MMDVAKRASTSTALAVTTGALLFIGCGDVDTFKLSPGEFVPREPADDWNGVIVELRQQADGCEVMEEGLRAFVGDQMEFHNCLLALPQHCELSARVPVAVDVQPRSIIYDFSNIDAAGAFQDAGFNGYVVADLLRIAPNIAAARIDHEQTTLELDDVDIAVEDGSVHVNFAGLDFDDNDFVKIDLEFDDAAGSP